MTAELTQDDDDLWSWVDAEHVDELDVPSGDGVVAVMVVRNGESWVRDAIASVRALDVRPRHVVVVDNASTDATRQILDAAADEWLSIVEGDATWGFGRAVAAGLDTVAPAEWLWLLHDDVVVKRDALGKLLEQTARTPDADIVGPMLLRPTRRSQAARIAELGISISHTGRRDSTIDPGEVAQGQHESADSLGVSTCGMLIRRSTFDEIGGFDDAVPLFRDGVELGWRARLAGHRVVTCPAARITHREAGRSGRRAGTLAAAAGRTPAAYDRTMAMRTVAAHSAGPAALLVSLRLLVGSVLRALGYLLGKRVDLARQEIGAASDFLRSGRAVRSLRRRVRAISPTADGRRGVSRLRPHAWSSWSVAAETVARAASDRFRAFTTAGDSVTLDELTGDDFADRSQRSQGALLPILGAVGVLVIGLVAGRRILGLGQLLSSGLLPAPSSLGAGFASYLSPPPGLAGEHPAWLGLAAIASVPFVVPGWSAVAALLLGVPAAAVACGWYLEPYVASVRARWLTAVLYGLLPVLVGGYSRGQVWLVVWAVALPLLGVCLRAWGVGRGLDGWRAPAGAALVLAVLASIAPLALVVGGACLVGVAVRRRAGVPRALLAVAASAVLLLPWAPALLRHPGRLLTGPEPLLGTVEASSAWGAFLARSAGPGLPPLWLSVTVFGLLWLGAAVALYLRPAAWGVWAGAAGCLTLAAVLSRLLVTVNGGLARPEVTMWLVAGFGLLLVGSATAVDRARADLAEADFGLGQSLVLVSSVVGVVALVLATGWWMWGGVGAPLTRTDASSVPVYIRDAEVAQQSRALLVSLRPDSVGWLVDEPGHPRWGDGEAGLVLGGSPDAVAAARTIVAQIASGKQVDGLAAGLANLGISHVRVSGAGSDVSAALGSTPGLQRGTDDPTGTVWLVLGKPSRTQIVDGATVSHVTTAVPTGSAGRILVLAEPPDPRRTVVVGGTTLAPVTGPDWRAAYDLGSASGQVDLRLAQQVPWWAWLQLVGLGLLALFAAPSLQRDDDEVEAVAPRRASGNAEVLS